MQVAESIRALLDECSAHARKRPEQCVATTSVIYTDVMNERRYRTTMNVIFKVGVDTMVVDTFLIHTRTYLHLSHCIFPSFQSARLVNMAHRI